MHRYNRLSLLTSAPGEVRRSWSFKTCFGYKSRNYCRDSKIFKCFFASFFKKKSKHLARKQLGSIVRPIKKRHICSHKPPMRWRGIAGNSLSFSIWFFYRKRRSKCFLMYSVPEKKLPKQAQDRKPERKKTTTMGKPQKLARARWIIFLTRRLRD